MSIGNLKIYVFTEKGKENRGIKPRFFDWCYPKSMEDRSQYVILVILPLSTQVKLYLITEMGSPCQKNGRKTVGRRLSLQLFPHQKAVCWDNPKPLKVSGMFLTSANGHPLAILAGMIHLFKSVNLG